MLKLFNNRARAAILEQNEKVDSGLVARKAHSTTVRAKVTRADGTVEPERIVSYGHRNFFIHAAIAPLAFLNGALWNWYYTRKRTPT